MRGVSKGRYYGLVMVLTFLFIFSLGNQKVTGEEIVIEFAGYNREGDTYTRAHKWWAEEIEKRSNNRVKINFHWGGSLLSPRNLASGIGRGGADAGLILAVMTPSRFPLSHAADSIFVTESPDSAAKAFTELLGTYDPILKEWERANLKPLSANPIGAMVLGFREKVNRLEDMRGKKIRVVGKYASDIKRLGGIPAAIAMPEIYEALKRGTIDGLATITLDLFYALSLQEVAKYVLNPGFGVYGVTCVTSFNADKWKSLPSDIKEIIANVSKDLIDKETEMMMGLERKAKEAISKAGAELYSLTLEEKNRWKQAVTPDKYIESLESKGLPANAMFKRYVDLVRKYEKQSNYISPFK